MTDDPNGRSVDSIELLFRVHSEVAGWLDFFFALIVVVQYDYFNRTRAPKLLIFPY